MSYNPATDFVGVWRAIAGGVQKGEVPGLDLVVAAFGRANLINVSVSNIAPVANQAVTAWFQPAVPSYSAEGGLQLWNAVGAAYVAATPRLFLEMLAAAEKVAAVPTAISSLLDTLGAARGDIAFRGAASWQALAPGTAGYLLTSGGAGADPLWSTIGSIGGALDGVTNTVGAMVFRGGGGWTGTGAGAINTLLVNTVANTPAWQTLSAYIDSVMGNARGDLLTRGAALWGVLAPGTATAALTTGGAGADPVWSALLVAAGTASLSRSGGGGVPLQGTNTNDSPAAGFVGEMIENIQAVPQNFSATTVYGDVTSVALSAGDWDVCSIMVASANGATVTQIGSGIGTAAGASSAGLTTGSNLGFSVGPTAGDNDTVVIPSFRVSLAAPATIYLKAVANYTVATPQFVGRISARRVR